MNKIPPDSQAMETDRPQSASGWEPRIVAMVCRWCTYAGADLAGTSRLTYPAAVRLVRFPCTGRMNPLFILKAFEHGADGVIVSGCHPGDCHYVQGNLYARRRFATFKALMEFVGLDPRRLHFAWVSASEGSKWAAVVHAVHEAVRAVGPASTHGDTGEKAALPAPAGTTRALVSKSRQEALRDRLRELATGLIREQEVSCILGYRRGSLPGKTVPAFFTRPEELGELVWDSQCHNNLSVYLPTTGGDGKVAAVVKQCDAASVVGLLQEQQLQRDRLHLIGVQCHGAWDGDRLAHKCRGCDGDVPPFCDTAVTEDEVLTAEVAAEPDPRDAAIAYLESLAPQSRWNFWREQFESCLRCYACRAVCPLCYCETCIADKHRPQWISPAIDETGNTAWNLIRAFHLAGRCTGCDECARVCPADIRLDLINRKLARVVEQRFGYKPGADAQAAPIFTEFKDGDPEEFIL